MREGDLSQRTRDGGLDLSRHWLIKDGFFSGADQLRGHFERQFAHPERTSANRFVWDYWHVPNQYTVLRTPAFHYFPTKLYERWHHHIVNWGREVLGCHDISPPWLSCYVDGCEQEIHSDHPHGPWAFVFSLTPWTKRRFTGGETQILRPEVMKSWATHSDDEATESEQLTAQISPRFNRLVVFDPRLPHRVRQVQGVRDPRLGRLVMHGWFVQPRPFFKGPLTESQVAEVLERGVQGFGAKVATLGLSGYLSLRLSVTKSGRVQNLKWLTNTLVGERADLNAAKRELFQQFHSLRFPAAKKSTLVTLPLRLTAAAL